MGLLDDAIREHLELKRRAGADPGEVARLEHEAFGEEAPGAEAGEDVDAEASSRAVEPPDAQPQAGAEPPVSEARPESGGEPARPIGGGAPVADAPVEQPTERFTLEEHHAAERPAPPVREEEPRAEDEDEDDAEREQPIDELEETPDFLQETPEHDRLWFEQKPPRDFDF